MKKPILSLFFTLSAVLCLSAAEAENSRPAGDGTVQINSASDMKKDGDGTVQINSASDMKKDGDGTVQVNSASDMKKDGDGTVQKMPAPADMQDGTVSTDQMSALPDAAMDSLGSDLDSSASAPQAPAKKKKKKGLIDFGDMQQNDSDEINISADHMQMLMEGNLIDLDGNAIVQNSTASLVADKMRAYLKENNELRKIDAEGNVTIRKLLTKESATGDFGTYDAETGIMTLTGHCTLMQEDKIMHCQRITYNNNTQVIKAQRGTIVLKNLKKKDKPAPKGDAKKK